MDDTSLNTNITQNEGIEIVCSAYEKLYEATHLFLHITWEKLNAWIIPKENSFQFNGKLYRQTHGIAIDKTVSFANIFMEYIETQSLRENVFKSTVWKRHMGDIFPVGKVSQTS